MEQFSDTYLIRRVQQGELEAATIIYERYKKPLWTFFFNCIHERSQSDDLVQLTFEKMIRYRLNYSGKGSFKSWLFSIARNVLKDAWHHKERQHNQRSLEGNDKYIQDGSPSVEDHLISQDRQEILQEDQQSALEESYKLIKAHPEISTEQMLNSLGYHLSGKQAHEKALKVFELNTEQHPDSWNVWDSLAEGLEMAGKRDLAIRYYRQSLDLNPDNHHARNRLADLVP